MTQDRRYQPVEEQVISDLVRTKFSMKYSSKLGKMVYVLNEWLDKEVFERHKSLFGYTDIGWTVKYPRHLSRVLYIEGIW